MKDYGNVRIVSIDHDIIVERFVEYNDMGWTKVRSFHEISNDYAITNAYECARELVEKTA